MSHSSDQCPGVAAIERLAAGDSLSPDVIAHVESCASCQARLAAARDEAAFIDRVRTVGVPALGTEGAPRIPGYRIIGVVSSGTQGVVYRAVQESTSRLVAIKTLDTGPTVSQRHRVRAEREAEIAARLRHPNIVTVFEARSLTDGRIAVIMEFVDGVPLDRWKPAGSSHAAHRRALLQVCSSICAAVHQAHLNAVIHRDLKPDNILVTPEGRPVVLDFGIAKADDVNTTLTGEFAGTPAYASPEQVSGRPDDVDALTDVYSLGVILYRIVCGAMPYELEGSIFDIAQTISQTEPTPPNEHVASIPSDLQAIILRAIHKVKQRRYQSAAALADDLDRFLAGDPVEARSGSGWYLLRKALSMNRRRILWTGAVTIMLIVAILAVVISAARAAESARLALLQREQARAERVRTRAVAELLREALPNRDPWRPSEASAVNAGLARLYLRLESGAFAAEPDVDLALRRLWGSIYTDFGDGKTIGLVEYAEVSLRNGLVRLRMEHADDHADIADAMHELAGVLLVRRRSPEAEGWCRAALEMRERLLGQDDAAVAMSRMLLARILVSRARPEEALHEADVALAMLRSLPEGSDALWGASMKALKARIAFDTGFPDHAEPLLVEALTERLRSLPPEDPQILESLKDAARLVELAPDSHLAAVMCQAWGAPPRRLPADVRRDLPILGATDRGDTKHVDPRGRTMALARLLRLQETLLGPKNPALIGVLVAQMRAAESEHLLEPRATAALRAASILSERFAPDDFSVLLCLENAATVLAFTDRPERAVDAGSRACEIWDAVPSEARDRLLAANSRRRLGQYLALADRHEEAIVEYERVLDELRQTVGPDHHTFALTQSGLALSQAEIGDLRTADELSSSALRLAERLPATPVDQLDHIQFVRGHVLASLGQYQEARALLDAAWDPFFRFAGPDYVWRQMFVDDMARACEATGQTALAKAWRAQIEQNPVKTTTDAP